MSEQYYVAADLAAMFKVSQRTIWAWVKAKKLPPGIKLSHKTMIWPQWRIEAYLNEKGRAA